MTETDSLITSAVKSIIIVAFIIVSVIFAIWFLRRLIGRMQNRIGPNVRGPFGFFQVLFDAGKLILKEDVITKASHKIIYIVAPFISVFSAFMIFAVIPLGNGKVKIPFTHKLTNLQLTDFEGSILYILAISSIGVFGIALGGWAANSTYSLLGAIRSCAQVISYELCMSISIITVVLVTNSTKLGDIANSHTKLWIVDLIFPSFVFYFISALGEINHLPFDLPEAEGELTGGYATEYSSMKFAWYYLSEFINAFNISAVAVTIFFGSAYAPWPFNTINNNALSYGWVSIVWFLLKTWIFMAVLVWIRATVIRFRFDQFIKLGWKYLIPANFCFFTMVLIYKFINQYTHNFKLSIFSSVLFLVIVILLLPVKENKKTYKKAKVINNGVYNTTIDYEKRNIFYKIFGPFLGFWVTFRNIFKKPVTIQYPNKVGQNAKAKWHGIHQLNKYEKDKLEKCIACELCAWACPVNAIKIVAGENTSKNRVSHGEKYAKVYEIDYSRCIFCGFCIEACPTRALTMTNNFEIFGYNRNDLVYGKEKLLK